MDPITQAEQAMHHYALLATYFFLFSISVTAICLGWTIHKGR